MTLIATKPRLLIVELWGLGDLVIGTPFLRAATEHYEVTIVAKPYATELQPRLWPGVKVLPFVAPWTAFRHKYRLWRWPVGRMTRLLRQIRATHFDVAISARWDPRDHFLLALAGATKRYGFPRMGSRMFLTDPIARPIAEAHRYENWRTLGKAMGLELPVAAELPQQRRAAAPARQILLHTGSAQSVRVWPLENYRQLVERLRKQDHPVQVACDPDQREWWLQHGETSVATPHSVTELLALVDQATVFIGNDSGPGHLAAFADVPTFTIFGPQVPEWFAPLHPAARWAEGRACPYKPCSDYCRLTEPICLTGWSEPEIWAQVEQFLPPAGAV